MEIIIRLILLLFLSFTIVDGFSDQSKRPLHPKQLRDLNKKISVLKKRSTPIVPTTTQSNPVEDHDYKENFSSLLSEERIQKVIAHAGLASRRDAEKMILDGRVALNGKKITALGTKMNAKKDKLYLDGKLVVIPNQSTAVWILLNKPKDVLSTLEDDKNRETILNYLPKANDLRLVPVGRMDRDTSGLLLLTNDVGWIHPLTHPSYRNYQRFEVTIRGDLTVGVVDALREGKLKNPVNGEYFPPVAVYVAETNDRDKTWLLDFIIEDVPATILFDIIYAWGCEYLSSRRTEFGPIKLKGLNKGDWKELNSNEVTSLKQYCTKVSPGTRIYKSPSRLVPSSSFPWTSRAYSNRNGSTRTNSFQGRRSRPSTFK